MIDTKRETLLTIPKAAKLRQCCPATIKKMFRDGLEYVRVGKLRKTSEEAFQRFDHRCDEQINQPSPVEKQRIERAVAVLLRHGIKVPE